MSASEVVRRSSDQSRSGQEGPVDCCGASAIGTNTTASPTKRAQVATLACMSRDVSSAARYRRRAPTMPPGLVLTGPRSSLVAVAALSCADTSADWRAGCPPDPAPVSSPPYSRTKRNTMAMAVAAQSRSGKRVIPSSGHSLFHCAESEVTRWTCAPPSMLSTTASGRNLPPPTSASQTAGLDCRFVSFAAGTPS